MCQETKQEDISHIRTSRARSAPTRSPCWHDSDRLLGRGRDCLWSQAFEDELLNAAPRVDLRRVEIALRVGRNMVRVPEVPCFLTLLAEMTKNLERHAIQDPKIAAAEVRHIEEPLLRIGREPEAACRRRALVLPVDEHLRLVLP